MTDRPADGYWFAAPLDAADEDYDIMYPWVAFLQCRGHVMRLSTSYATKADCENAIRSEVLGRPLVTD